jgi:cytochrome c oxidase subunit IV
MSPHKEPNYLMIIVILGILTAVEIAVTFAPLPKLSIGILLVGLALTKAIMVAMFFMHLKFEKITLALIAATPLVLCAFLMFMLLPDSNPAKNAGQVTAANVQTAH